MMGGDTTSALVSFQESLAIDRRLASIDTGSADAQRDLAVDLQDIGEAQMMHSDVANALASFQESLIGYRRLAASDPSSAEALQDLAEILGKLGDAQVASVSGDATLPAAKGTETRAPRHDMTPLPKTA
jgi:tetratricopeptide (TPR) repeat protein